MMNADAFDEEGYLAANLEVAAALSMLATSKVTWNTTRPLASGR